VWLKEKRVRAKLYEFESVLLPVISYCVEKRFL
jgi:hypothetical protein